MDQLKVKTSVSIDKDIYDKIIRIYTKKYLRPEVKFNDLDELVKQIDQDKIESLKIL